jgi:peptide-methionine (S)-S-oxide reductase
LELVIILVISCNPKLERGNSTSIKEFNTIKMQELSKEGEQSRIEEATFAGGCFWCTEAVFLELEGVNEVISGYIGGLNANPSYREVCNGDTGHAEAIQINFDAEKISFGELLEIFFATHDPTTLNRQGNDVGTQYRSEIFYHNEAQQKTASDYIELMTNEDTFGKRIVTKISSASIFYEAEKVHQNYYNDNKSQGYCSYIITPKIDKLKKSYKDKLKK